MEWTEITWADCPGCGGAISANTEGSHEQVYDGDDARCEEKDCDWLGSFSVGESMHDPGTSDAWVSDGNVGELCGMCSRVRCVC